ncbi:MAG: hypothetical protein JO118_04465, partial [Acetobacteraceae bacterium]|nr:hypothetical protein [Acetobacteraceae bacterium]
MDAAQKARDSAAPSRGPSMKGLMQEHPLLISSVLAHAARHHGAGEVVARTSDGALH